MLIAELTVPEDKRIGTVTKSLSAIHASGTQTIQNLARVSKGMNAIANTIMYRSIVLADSETAILLLQSLLLFPHNRELIQHLEVRPPAKAIGLGPPLAEPSRFFDFNKVLESIYESEAQHPQLPPEFVGGLRVDFQHLTPQQEWETGRYPRGGFNTVTAIIIHLCHNLTSLKVRTMGEWFGSTCNLTETAPGHFLHSCSLHSCLQHSIPLTFAHLQILNLDVSIAYRPRPFSMRCYGCDLRCPPNIRELTLRHENASLSRNFVDEILQSHWDCLGSFLFQNRFFFKPCYQSLRKLRLLGGFDHAGLSDPSNLFSPQIPISSLNWNAILGDLNRAGVADLINMLSPPSEANWNGILPLLQQLTHLEFAGYGDPCPPDDRHRITWPDNVYRYGPKKTFSCLAKLPNLQYLKLPLLDLFPLPPSAFPDTHKALVRLLYPGAVDGIVPHYRAPYHCRRPRKMMIEAANSLAMSLDTGLGIQHNIEQKLREAAGGCWGEIPSNLERVDLYYYVQDTDSTKDPRERWAKSSQYAHLSRGELKRLEKKLRKEGGWFPTKEVVITWRRKYRWWDADM